MGDMRNVYKFFVGKPEEKRPFGRPRHRWNDNRLDIKEVGWEAVSWIYLAKVRDQSWADVNMVMNTGR
jgi:hypothetical protein